MISHQNLHKLLSAATFRLLNGIPNSDLFVSTRLKQAKLEREKLISIIADDAALAEEIDELKTEVKLIDNALIAYA